MNTLITGSQALLFHLKDSFWRKPLDTDLVGFSVNNFELDLTKFERSIPSFLYTNPKEKLEFFSVDLCPPLQEIVKRNVGEIYMDLSNILIMKNAHKHFYMGKYEKSFKHLEDYSRLLEVVQLTEEEKELSLRYRDWLVEFAYNSDPRLLHTPKLNMTKEKFFTDSVKYYVDHDWIHELVAIEKEPAYKKCLTGEVMFSNVAFNKLDYQSKVNMVLEESFVLAIERCLLPFLHGETLIPAFTPSTSFKYALTRVATNITSGTFRDFAADNFYKIYAEYSEKHLKYYKAVSEIYEKCR